MSKKSWAYIRPFQGTTGSPKGACLTHHNVVNNAYFVGKRLGYDKKVRSVVTYPVPLLKTARSCLEIGYKFHHPTLSETQHPPVYAAVSLLRLRPRQPLRAAFRHENRHPGAALRSCEKS